MDWGGSPDIVRLICSSLDPEKFDVTLVFGKTRYLTSRSREFLNSFGGKIVEIHQLRRDICPLMDTAALLRLYALFRRERFDIVHTHTAKAGCLGRIAAAMAGRGEVVHSTHGHNFYGYFGRFGSFLIVQAERFLSAFAWRIVVQSSMEMRDFIDYGVCAPEKLVVVTQGVDTSKYARDASAGAALRKRWGFAEGDIVFAFIGRLEPIKGAGLFLQAAMELVADKTGCRFVIIGSGTQEAVLRRFADERGLGRFVVFTGWIDDIGEALSGIDVVVLPSLNDAVGRVLLEAQSAGIPVIATRVGGIPDVVKDGHTGIIVPPSDSGALAAAMRSLAADSARRAAMGASAKDWAAKQFPLRVMLDEYRRLYENCVRLNAEGSV
jgi:glycosyltransferase involved in cell wall biosynthesis